MDLDKKLASFQEISKIQLALIFSSYPGPKYLILQDKVIKPLETICGVQWLKNNGVVKIFRFESGTPTFEANGVFYFIYSDVTIFRKVVNQIRSSLIVETSKNKFHIILVPTNLHIYEKELENFGLISDCIKMHSFHWLPLYVDEGVLSLELPFMYGQIFVNQNLEYLPSYAKSLRQLFLATGVPKLTVAVGTFSNIVIKQLDRICDEKGTSTKLDSFFGGLLLIDRSVDYACTLLTPGTYSALLNEVYGVEVGSCELKGTNGASITLDSKYNPVVGKPSFSIQLNSKADNVYASIKHKYFTEVTSELSKLTKALKDEKQHSKDMDVPEIKKYVQTQLQATSRRKKNVANHLVAVEGIINSLGSRYERQLEVEYNVIRNTNKTKNFDYLLETISTENDKLFSLRLFCLLSLTQKLNDNEVRQFWKRFLDHFGFRYCFLYQKLQDAGFIAGYRPGKLRSSNQFYTNLNRFKQIPSDAEKVDIKHPTCGSYAFGGTYIPFAMQIASMIINSTPLTDIKSKLDSEVFSIKNEKFYPIEPRVLLVYILGGVTYSEIAAFNLLEALTGTKIVVLSDRITSGNHLTEALLSNPSGVM